MVLPIVVLVVWSRSQSQSPVTTDSESVRPSAPFGARDRILLFYCLSLERCSLCLCRAPSLTRGRTVIVVSSLFTVMQYFQYYIVVIHNELFCYIYSIYHIDQASVSPGFLPQVSALSAVQSLERLQAWPPTSLSLLYFLCWALPCPMLQSHCDDFVWRLLAAYILL
jgi:hypothetical protein